MGQPLKSAGAAAEGQIAGGLGDAQEAPVCGKKRRQRGCDVCVGLDQPRQDGRILWGGQVRRPRRVRGRMWMVGTLCSADPTRSG